MEQVTFNKWLAAILALIVGLGAGIVGAGGSFLFISAHHAYRFKNSNQGNDCVFISHHFHFFHWCNSRKISTGQVDFYPALIMVVASLIASPLGAMAGKKMNVKVLQVILALLILATAVKTWVGIMS
ncbi:TSUP family transporter [Peribacillus butanolivorans]|uniref:TSUP family transporter n=1 Tax=Peribacillus butanolivorans TaxID=421767 RepID=UPI0035E02219